MTSSLIKNKHSLISHCMLHCYTSPHADLCGSFHFPNGFPAQDQITLTLHCSCNGILRVQIEFLFRTRCNLQFSVRYVQTNGSLVSVQCVLLKAVIREYLIAIMVIKHSVKMVFSVLLLWSNKFFNLSRTGLLNA